MVVKGGDAEYRYHAHCGAQESLGMNPEEGTEAGRKRSGPRNAHPAPLQLAAAELSLCFQLLYSAAL